MSAAKPHTTSLTAILSKGRVRGYIGHLPHVGLGPLSPLVDWKLTVHESSHNELP